MERLKQFSNSSSWREDNVRIESGECFTVSFFETKPNMFYLQNPNATNLHVGISKIPTAKSYEFKVPSNSSKAFGRPTGTQYLYIYNNGNIAAEIKLFSLNDKFDLSVLDSVSMSIDGVNVEIDSEIVVGGFAEGVSLPSGTNQIGLVDLPISYKNHVEKIHEYSMYLDSLVTDINNKIGVISQKMTYGENLNILLDILRANEQTASAISGLTFPEIDNDNTGLIDGLLKKNLTESIELDFDLTITNTGTVTTTGILALPTADDGWYYSVAPIQITSKGGTPYTIGVPTYDSTNNTLTFTIGTQGTIVLPCYKLESKNCYNVFDFITELNKMMSPETAKYIKGTAGNFKIYQCEKIINLRNIYDYNGILSNFPRRIKDPYCTFTAELSKGGSTSSTFTLEQSTETHPVKCADRIQFINNVGDVAVKARIFYTWADYFEVYVGANSQVGSFDLPVYAVQILLADSTAEGTAKVSVYGGYYDV